MLKRNRVCAVVVKINCISLYLSTPIPIDFRRLTAIGQVSDGPNFEEAKSGGG